MASPDRNAKRTKSSGTWTHVGVAVVATFAFASSTRPAWALACLRTLGTIAGVAVGVGLGLGLALHVCELLQTMQSSQEEQKASRVSQRSLKSPQAGGVGMLEDSHSYASLMASVGYHGPSSVLRGQIVKDRLPEHYAFTRCGVDEQFGPKFFAQMQPGLPEPVNEQLGRFTEHVMRDYVSTWYSMLDCGIIYRDEKKRRGEGKPRDAKDPTEKMEETENAETSDSKKSSRSMVFSLDPYRKIPMMEHTYKTIAVVFSNLAGRVENVNIFSLAMLKFTRVLALTFKEYRTLRRIAAAKLPPGREPSELHVTREFLLAGKLHRALTFGMDVPSLLFADAAGTECGTGTEQDPKNDLQVLEQRLFHTPLLQECELDYNRVVAHRICKACLPKSEFSSSLVSSLVVQIMAGSVLQPLMGCFYPAMLNGWVVAALSTKPAKEETGPVQNEVLETVMPTQVVADENNSNDANDDANENQNEKGVAKSNANDDAQQIEGTDTNGAIDDNIDSADEGQSQIIPNSVEEDDSTGRSRSDSALLDRYDSVEDMGFIAPGTGEDVGDEEESLFDDDVDDVEGEITDDDEMYGSIPSKTSADNIQTLLTMGLIELQQNIDFDEPISDEDWNNPGSQAALQRLVLVIEAAILHGRCSYEFSKSDAVEDEVEADRTKPGLPLEDSFLQVFMELAADISTFEARVEEANSHDWSDTMATAGPSIECIPHASEISTLRTIISTWLHTGQIYHAVVVIAKAHKSLLLPFYGKSSFLAGQANADGFTRQIKFLEGVEVSVDTMAILSAEQLDLSSEGMAEAMISVPTPLVPAKSTPESNPVTRRKLGLARIKSGFGRGAAAAAAAAAAGQAQQQSDDNASDSVSTAMAATPRHLDFHRNAAFASSLRAENERRMRSWDTRQSDSTVSTVSRYGAPDADKELHTELHSLARIFFNGTNIISIRDAARRQDPDETISQAKVSLLTVEMASNRRRIEVPDDDSSFLLRAQPRPLNPVSVHRDDRNHDQSYKCFLATYEEPAFASGTNRYRGGRYIRRCLLQFYPIDRTASIMMHNDQRKLDKRKGVKSNSAAGASGTSTVGSPASAPYLTGSFLRERHLCNKWASRASAQNFLISSSVMESTDFNATPRSGKALDFVYRMSLFERPIVDLAGKRFSVHDSTARGAHRADASSLEISDAALSSLLLTIGEDWQQIPQKQEAPTASDDGAESGDAAPTSPPTETRHMVEMGPDGYPYLFMKFSRKQGEKTSVDIKPYRISFVRAALMVTSSRQEAQLQSLIDCVRAGSAKSATKARTEAQLRPTLKILEFANDKGSDKASCLLRDLKLGVYHIDREQLRRNGLIGPRYPTVIKHLVARVEGAFHAKDVEEMKILPPNTVVFRIRCRAIVGLSQLDEHQDEYQPYRLKDGTFAESYREEWVVHRPMKDFHALHKQLKSQVSTSEASASTGSKLVGVATAAFGNNANPGACRQREALVPSLAQLGKLGSISMTRKALFRRGELLNGYLSYLLSPHHFLNRSTELLQFLGANYPFPVEVQVDFTPKSLVDPMGRGGLVRKVATEKMATLAPISQPKKPVSKESASSKIESSTKRSQDSGNNKQAQVPKPESDKDLSILSKVDQVPLAKVRDRMAELLRLGFGFENASFLRSRMLAAIETVSFVAMTKTSDFRELLYNLHVEQLNPVSIAGYIEMVLDLLWPDGVWMETSPELTKQEEKDLSDGCREKLHAGFPDQIRSILGQELTEDALDMFHEMLQNRIVLKSLFYMIFDLVWIEIFPGMDVLSCASALE